ncbi:MULTISPECIES: fructosamine kinase family protein [Allobacillus]|uniref:Fructosamine kinase family protein n=1 Tax=Allobacillus halotolerans TaxID=570278 RepID=A0ABS6GPN3_9BACI|nr:MULTISPECIES: fructosamine kinase family protein [Allobacillus]MBU6080604.1 fructosamine kinase family protein [Allobacillus halotolerans]TSJ68353.1 fructosamine kinase family protein [Allobacillus sp. SKP2-8]
MCLVNKLFEQTGIEEAIQQIQSVSGGSINDSYWIQTASQQYFMKVHTDSPQDFFHIEKTGLDQIRSTKTIHVPEVINYSDEQGEAYLLMEWVEGKQTSKTDVMLGRNLALMHQQTNSKHGFYSDTYIGTLPQTNAMCASWVDYYRDFRLKNQLELGIQTKRIHGVRREKLERLMERLDELLPNDVSASYLHGDLWGGNWLVGPKGVPYLIDPSFLYGHRLFELAFTELFGGFSQTFYNEYNEVYPIDSYYKDIKEIYQLYYLLVHLNLFGEMYGASVDRILNRYS